MNCSASDGRHRVVWDACCATLASIPRAVLEVWILRAHRVAALVRGGGMNNVHTASTNTRTPADGPCAALGGEGGRVACSLMPGCGAR